MNSQQGEWAMAYVPIPTIVERTPRGERAWDLFSRMLQERVVLLGTPIDNDVATSIVAQLLFLQHSDPERDIWFYINSPGGSVRDGLAIYDTMRLIAPDVNTVCIGRAGSMATILLAGGAKGKRFALPNATIHFHPAGGGGEGYAPDLERMVKELLRIQRIGNDLLAEATGRTAEEIENDFSRDRFMTPLEAKEYGFIDEILDHSTIAR
jgi:ATP-dependent Clp protease protease subunit